MSLQSVVMLDSKENKIQRKRENIWNVDTESGKKSMEFRMKSDTDFVRNIIVVQNDFLLLL